MIRNLLDTYIAAEQACLTASGLVSDDAMDSLTDAAHAARAAVWRAITAGEGDEASRVEFGRLCLGFDWECEPDPEVLALLAIPPRPVEFAAAA